MIRGKWGGGGGGVGRSPKIFFKALWASLRSKNKGAPGPSSGSASGNEHFAPWKVIRISGTRNSLNFFLVESGIPLTIGIRSPSSSVGSSVAGEGFLLFFLLVKIQLFQVSIRYRTHGHV